MPCDYVIDREQGIVFSTGSGVVTVAELLAHQDKLTADPTFSPGFRQLMDLTQVSRFDTAANDIYTVASRNIFGPGSRRALVAGSDLNFGLARSFELMRTGITKGESQEEIMVFRDLAEARRWLGLE